MRCRISTIASVLAFALIAAPSASADVVAARTLKAGTILAHGDLRSTIGPADPALGDMLGLEVRRAVYVGRPVVPSLLGPPTVVKRNSIVMMVYRTGTLGIRAEGRAMGSGGLGERIDVMNSDSRLTVRATIAGPGQVVVK